MGEAEKHQRRLALQIAPRVTGWPFWSTRLNGPPIADGAGIGVGNRPATMKIAMEKIASPPRKAAITVTMRVVCWVMDASWTAQKQAAIPARTISKNTVVP